MISIIIVNYNAKDILLENIRNLLSLGETIHFEIIIIDNHSSDGSADAVEEITKATSQIQLIRNDRNLGFSAACNQGIHISTGEYLLFLNPDCMVDEKSLLSVLNALENDPTAGMAGGLLLNHDGSEQRGCRRDLPDFKKSFYHASGLSKLLPRAFSDFNKTRQALPEGPEYVEAISGAFMLVKRSALDTVGVWDEGYFLHVEDLDLCKRFSDHNYRILFVPDARIVHVGGVSTKNYPIRVEWHKHRSMWRFYRKFQSSQNSVILDSVVALSIYTHMFMRMVVKVVLSATKK